MKVAGGCDEVFVAVENVVVATLGEDEVIDWAVAPVTAAARNTRHLDMLTMLLSRRRGCV